MYRFNVLCRIHRWTVEALSWVLVSGYVNPCLSFCVFSKRKEENGQKKYKAGCEKIVQKQKQYQHVFSPTCLFPNMSCLFPNMSFPPTCLFLWNDMLGKRHVIHIFAAGPYYHKITREGPDQSMRMRMPILTFCFRIWHNGSFLVFCSKSPHPVHWILFMLCLRDTRRHLICISYNTVFTPQIRTDTLCFQ